MAIATMYVQHVPFDQRHSAMVSQSRSTSTSYHDRLHTGAPAIRTTSLPASMPHGTSRYTLDPVFSIQTARANWKKLPSSVLNSVLDHLRTLHLGSRSSSCSTCYMRDMTSVQLACKAWFS